MSKYYFNDQILKIEDAKESFSTDQNTALNTEHFQTDRYKYFY